jgi:hypothetical protein
MIVKYEVTRVIAGRHRSLTVGRVPNKLPKGGTVQDIYEVLRKKKAQLEVLGEQIVQLQAAAEQLRSVAHLLQEGEEEGQGQAAGA